MVQKRSKGRSVASRETKSRKARTKPSHPKHEAGSQPHNSRAPAQNFSWYRPWERAATCGCPRKGFAVLHIVG